MIHRNEMLCLQAALQGWIDPLGSNKVRWASMADNVLARTDLVAEYGATQAQAITEAANVIKAHYGAGG